MIYGLVVIGLWVAMIVGWVMNIVALIGFSGTIATMGALEIARIIGIFVAPLGSILGLFF